jgi:pilus assembly protein CpaE
MKEPSMHKPKVLVVAAEEKTQSAVASMLKDVGVVVPSIAQSGAVVAEFTESRPNAVIVAASKDPEGAFKLVSELVAAGALVIVIGDAKDPDLILGAMRAGAREFLLQSDEEGLRRTLIEHAKPAEGRGPGGAVVTLFPTRGGVGCTSIATNLAHAVQKAGQRVCLVDFDLHLGDVLSFLDLPGTYSIADVLANIGRLDRELLDASIARHASGVRVLAQSGKVEEADHVHPLEVAQLLSFLRRHYDLVLVDGVRGFDEMSLAALDASQKILVVLTQDVPAVRNTKRCLDLFRRLGYGDAKVTLVLNRYQKDPDITPHMIEEMTGLPVGHTLSNDFASAISAINRGLPLQSVAPRSRLTKDIEQMVSLLVDRSRGVGKTTGFFRNLLSRKVDNGPAGTT